MKLFQAMPKWLHRLILGAILAVLVAGLLLYLDGYFTTKVIPRATTTAAAPVAAGAVFEVKYIEIPETEPSPGTIQPLHEVALASKVREPEKVVEVNVIAGQAVHKGDLLVKLDPTTWQNRRELSEAKLKSSQASLADAKRNFERTQELFRKGAATPSESDNAKYRFEGAQAEVMAAQRNLDEATMNLDYTRILAPMDAVVIDKRVDVGDTVSAGQTLVSLYDKMQLIASVREGLIRNLKPGQKIGVHLDDLGEDCVGTISEIVPQADPFTRTFQVKVVGPCRSGIHPGMYAKLLVPLGSRKVLVIPPSAVEQVGQLTMVNVSDNGAVQRRSVQLGRKIQFEGTQYVQVLSGLSDGEKIVLPSATEAGHGE
jgi:RND family efflux transporter MFP subunit